MTITGTGRRVAQKPKTGSAPRAAAVFVPPWIRRKRAAAKSSRAGTPGTRTGSEGNPYLRKVGPLAPSPCPAPGAPVVREVGERAPRWMQILGWDRIEEQPVFISTRQAEALNPAVVATHPPMAGEPAGIDVFTNNAISADPHLLYAQRVNGKKRITSAHFVILGCIGSGKTSFAMTNYCIRQVAKGKQVALFDRKQLQEDGSETAGEYADAARECGGEIIRFSRDGGRSLNLLDPRIARTSDDKDGIVGQDELVRLAAEYAHGPLTAKEGWALSAAHRQAVATAKAQNRVATMHDVIEALFDPGDSSIPHESLSRRRIVNSDDLVSWGLDLALDLHRFVTGDLSGLIDATTSEDINWEAPLLVFDTSDLPENSPALSLVMMLVSTFLSSVWSARTGQRVILLEEGYHTNSLAGPGSVTVAGILRSLIKRGRGIGLAFGIVIHHISDIPKDSEAVSLIKEAGIIHVYKQDKLDDVVAVIEQYGFPADVAADLMNLDQGVQIIRIGSEAPRLMRHVRSSLERDLTDSDAAMENRAKQRSDQVEVTA